MAGAGSPRINFWPGPVPAGGEGSSPSRSISGILSPAAASTSRLTGGCGAGSDGVSCGAVTSPLDACSGASGVNSVGEGGGLSARSEPSAASFRTTLFLTRFTLAAISRASTATDTGDSIAGAPGASLSLGFRTNRFLTGLTSAAGSAGETASNTAGSLATGLGAGLGLALRTTRLVTCLFFAGVSVAAIPGSTCETLSARAAEVAFLG
jgi:hypothetical protein